MVNPFLYAFTNDSFRESFISAFKCLPDMSHHTRRNSDYTVRGEASKAPTEAANKLNKSPPNNTSFRAVKRKLPLFGRRQKKNHTEYEFTTLNNEAANGITTSTDIEAKNGEIV